MKKKKKKKKKLMQPLSIEPVTSLINAESHRGGGGFVIVCFPLAGEPNGSIISLKVLGIFQFGCITFNTPFGPKLWVT